MHMCCLWVTASAGYQSYPFQRHSAASHQGQARPVGLAGASIRVNSRKQCDLLPARLEMFPTEQHLDLICANLPYIPTQTLYGLPVYGREPTLALDGGVDGLDLLRRLMQLAPGWLAPNALMLLEIEATRGLQALSLAYDMFSGAEIHLHQDLTGQDRLLEIAV